MYRNYLKRIIDLIVALILFVLFLPFFAIIAFWIKLNSPGPVFFTQKRGGRYGVYFLIFKFRSMTVDDHAEKKGFEPGSQNRVTSVGKILRKTKIDEFPQLMNVIRGEMSFVGPRPEVQKCLEYYPQRWCKILTIRPGITDPASIKFRNEEEILLQSANPEEEYRERILPHKLDLYEEYVKNISFMQDVKIVIKTIFTVFFKIEIK